MVFLDKQVFFCRVSGSFQGGQAVPHEESRISWGLDPYIPDAVDPFSHRFIILDPHGAVNLC